MQAPKEKRDGSTEAKLWCIKILSGAAYLYKAGKRVEKFLNIIGAQGLLQEPADSVAGPSGPSPPKKILKLEFTPINSTGAFQFAVVNPRYFNKFGSDDMFKKIESRTAEDLAEDINKALKELKKDPVQPVAENQSNHAQKRPQTLCQSLTPLFTEVATQSNKRQKGESVSRGETSHVNGVQERCNECQLDNKTHFIPIEKLVLPPKNRQIREVDSAFLKQLIQNMKDQPTGNYEALFVAAKGISKKEEFKIEKIADYEYEVLGGTHVTLATKHLHEKFPDEVNYIGRVARIYIGLNVEEALWLGAMHNHTGSFRHDLSYRDEVEICRTQLFLPAEDCTGDPPSPPEFWRDMCSSLLNKTKRNLSEIFTMAQLSGEAWTYFNTLHALYEKAELKGQKAKATDIVKKGRPVLRQWHLKPLCKLSLKDQTFLLEKVAKCEMSLEELKHAAAEIKCLRPIQEAIVTFFQFSTWEDASDEFNNAVSPEKLLQFAGKDFEQTHEFQKYLEHLKRTRDGEMLETVDLVTGQLGAFGLIIFSNNFLDVQQNDVAKLPHYEGAFLTIGEAGKQCENAGDVIDTVSRMNFLKLTSFNIVLFTTVDEVKNLKDKMITKGASLAQHGHFYIRNKPQNEVQGPYLQESLQTFVVGHWSVSRQMTSRHLSVNNSENIIFLEHVASQCRRTQTLPVRAYIWFVQHLSREGDVVADVGSTHGYAMVAALKNGRSAVWINSTFAPNEKSAIEAKISDLVSSEVND